jgi:hypothetical protein
MTAPAWVWSAAQEGSGRASSRASPNIRLVIRRARGIGLGPPEPRLPTMRAPVPMGPRRLIPHRARPRPLRVIPVQYRDQVASVQRPLPIRSQHQIFNFCACAKEIILSPSCQPEAQTNADGPGSSGFRPGYPPGGAAPCSAPLEAVPPFGSKCTRESSFQVGERGAG